ncbi:MAG: hypothetical protein AAF907_06325, partial [Planctomycetota bacterium]
EPEKTAEEPAMTEPEKPASDPAEPNETPAKPNETPAEPETPAEEPASSQPKLDEPADDPPTTAARFRAAGFASLPAVPQQSDEPASSDQPPAETPSPKPAEKPEAEKPEAEKPKAEQPPAGGEKPAMSEPADAGESAGDGAAATEPGDAEEQPGEDEAEGDEPPPMVEPEEYLPLDEARREAIRQRLRDRAIDAAMAARIEAASNAMYAIVEDVWATVPSANDPESDLSEEDVEKLREEARTKIAERMTAYAEENGLSYKRLPFNAYPDLANFKGTVGAALEADGDRARSRLAIDPLFTNLRSPLFDNVRIGNGRDEKGVLTEKFAVWKTDQREASQQELEDEGVREAVTEAFKLLKAGEAAAARAKELAERASQEDKTLAEIAETETVTGEEGSEALNVLETKPFFRLGLVQPTIEDMMRGVRAATIRRNPVPTMESGRASEEFLDAAFDDLEPGAAKGVPGALPDHAVAVELIGREPTDERLPELYENFLRQARDNPRRYQNAAGPSQQAAIVAFVDGLFEK